MATLEDVKGKIVDYLYSKDFEKITVSELNAVSNLTALLQNVSMISDNKDDFYGKMLDILRENKAVNNDG